MAVARPVLGLVSLILVAAGLLFQFFVILSGVSNTTPLNRTYFIQVDTAGTAAPRNPSRWTFFYICGVQNGLNANCGAPVPALPFNPPENFGSTQGVPGAFIGTHHYYYLSRFMFAFYLIALFFAALALFTGLLALCTRLGSYLSGLTVAIAVFFQALAASLMTACFVQGRNAFRRNGQSAHLGAYAFGWTWAAFAAYFLAMVLFCVGGAVSKSSTTAPRKGGMFGRKASTRSRGSFIDSESQRRVKEEYE
ncbi:SUR7-domain-containing protein, partial [Aureobasidium melanogenum]